MKNKIINWILYFILLLSTLSCVSAGNMTINQLIASYNYNFNDGTLNITAKNDYMVDTNSNSLNDTLIINLTSNATSGIYMAYIDLNDPNGKIIQSINKTLSASDTNFAINFSTSLLNLNKYNYTIRIENSNSALVYEENNIETNTYTNYEKGTNITSITDENINNNYIRINLTLNITENQTANVTVVLSYNISSISSTEEETLTEGIKTISIDFDNETIKSTHYNGNFTIDSVAIGQKVIDTNKTTSIYNYETFAKTSYIKSYADGQIDTNNNNLSEYLEINFTVNIKSADTYRLEAELYDEFNNFVVYINRTKTLSTGEQIWQTRVNGSDIYKTKINGPYLISYAKLSIGNETQDITYNPYTTNVSYYNDFERPPLPDLVIAINITFNGTANSTNITINISNLGEAPAFNVFLDLFDNVTYTKNESIAFLAINESIIYHFNLSNSTNNTLYTAIADFDNLVDESNESNNIVQYSRPLISALEIVSLSSIYSSGNTRVFEFIINNAGETTLNNINWSIDFGDGNTTASIYNFNLSASEDIFVFVEYNYADNQSRTVTASAYVNNLNASKSTIIGSATDLQITSFEELYSMGREKVWEFIIKNNANNNLTDINWNITGTNTPITSIYSFNLTPNESIRVYIHENLTNYQAYTITAKAFTDALSDTETLSTRGKELEISNIKTLYTNGLTKIFEFLVTNTFTSATNNINWSFYTGESTITAIYLSNLTSWENIRVLIENNYSGSGNYNINASVKSEQYEDSENKTITV